MKLFSNNTVLLEIHKDWAMQCVLRIYK